MRRRRVAAGSLGLRCWSVPRWYCRAQLEVTTPAELRLADWLGEHGL